MQGSLSRQLATCPPSSKGFQFIAGDVAANSGGCVVTSPSGGKEAGWLQLCIALLMGCTDGGILPPKRVPVGRAITGGGGVVARLWRGNGLNAG